MTAKQLSHPQTPRRLSAAVYGDVLCTNAASVRSSLDAALRDAPESGECFLFELDLQTAKMIDSVGLNLLVWLIKDVRRRGGHTRLVIANANIDRTLQFTRLNQHADVVRANA
jgi:anti-anti-sigma factor